MTFSAISGMVRPSTTASTDGVAEHRTGLATEDCKLVVVMAV